MSSLYSWNMIQNKSTPPSPPVNPGPSIRCLTTTQKKKKKPVHLFSDDPYEWKNYLATAVSDDVFYRTRDLSVLFDDECEWVPAPLSVGSGATVMNTIQCTKSPNRSHRGSLKQQFMTSNVPVEDTMELTDLNVIVNGMKRFVSISGRTMAIGRRKYTPRNWHL